MKILKLPWLAHKEEHRKYEVYTADVSPDGERLATGGLDGKIRIWSIPDILKMLQKDFKLNDDCQAPLASMSRHTGSVTVVRFSPDGKFLASGSDDRILLIWERDEEQKQPIFGSENDKEHWNVRRRLVAHDNDIQDICWAPDSSILVTVGLDRSVIVWNGSTFEKIKRFDVHQSLVKGVIFDPANKYFATASDDRTLRIFRYHKTGDLNFSIEHVVSEPFKGSPITTYFRRLSWSPDGQHIAAPNATNGPVSSVSIISRGSWDTSVTLIGHDSPTEVVRFNPRLFKVLEKKIKRRSPIPDVDAAEVRLSEAIDGENHRSEGDENHRPESEENHQAEGEENHIRSGEENLRPVGEEAREESEIEEVVEEKVDSVIATAGQDKTLVIWSTGRAKPLLVAYDITSKSITDMVWSPDGTILFLTSLDGSIITIVFEDNELGVAIPLEKNVEQLHRYGVDKDSFDFPESVRQLELEDEARKLGKEENKFEKTANVESTSDHEPTKKSLDLPPPQGTVQSPTLLNVKRKEPATKSDVVLPPTKKLELATPSSKEENLKRAIVKNGRKRVAPTLISSGYSPTKPTENKSPSFRSQSPALKSLGSEDIFNNLKDKVGRQSFPMPRLGIHSLIMGFRERGVDKYYRGGEDMENSREENDREEKDGTDGAEAKVPSDHIMRLNSKTTPEKVWFDEPSTRYVETPNVLSDADVVLVEFGDLDDLYIMEVRNGVERGLQFDRDALFESPTKILSYHHGERVIDILIPEIIICALGSSKRKCWILATAEGNLLIYTSFGKHKLPKIALGHKAVKMATIDDYLVVLTESGLLYAWDIEKGICIHKKVPILPIMCNSPVDSNRVRIHKKITKISIDLKTHDLLLAFINPRESYCWSSSLGCWTANAVQSSLSSKLTPMSVCT
ncbi:LANO_0F07470g1_1 [Lachancea nothofagi CBS 11611]|uniref:Protein HIR n=1 Tax=Lachancea nothofagi CBS 11611 TaxID=1266666 RepID=A0A1G4K8Z1_9SACH|nr:LANO_0F07470g1_1 [Lachancea nothofagi CBS 11611]